MINRFEIANFGPIKYAKIDNLGRLNLIIGENSAGKSFILKALYSMHKTVEEYGKGDDIRKIKEIIADKLRWTFQADYLGELVKHNASTSEILIEDNNRRFNIRFGNKATVAVNEAENDISQLSYNSVFIPAREVFSIQKIILRSRDIEKVFGFDDSQYDLAKALQLIPTHDNSLFDQSKDEITGLMGGTVNLDPSKEKWQYVKNGVAFTIGTASEGIRKLGMLERLLENGYLSSDSIVFIDEIEAGLHPSAILHLIDVIEKLMERTNMQFFVSSHSYFVIKKMNLMARMRKTGESQIKCIMHNNEEFVLHDFSDGMPRNPIIDESVRLYEEEVDGVL